MIDSILFDKAARFAIGALTLISPLMVPVIGLAAENCPGAGMVGLGQGSMGGGMMMGGMGMGQGMMGMEGAGMMQSSLGMFEALDLTNEQKTVLKNIRNEQRKANWDVMGKVMDEQVQLRDLYAEDNPDPKKVGAAYARIAKLHQQMAEAEVAARNRMSEVLTKEQKDQLKEMRRASLSGGPMMPGAGMAHRR